MHSGKTNRLLYNITENVSQMEKRRLVTIYKLSKTQGAPFFFPLRETKNIPTVMTEVSGRGKHKGAH